MKSYKNTTIYARDLFALDQSPTAYAISVHVQNMMATYGEARVREYLGTLFVQEAPEKRKRSGRRSARHFGE